MIEGLLLDALALAIAAGVFLVLRRRLSTYRAAAALSQLLLEHRSEELEAFVGRVAHDLRDPLGVLALGIGAAERLGPASPQWRTILDRMKANVDRSEALIEGLLQFAQAGATPRPGQSTSVGPVVEALADQIRALGEEGLELRLDVEPATMACSRAALASICLNLLDNAVACTRYQPERRVELRVRRERERVRVEVEDNGPGIPRDLCESVFEPFARVPAAPEHGAGLGLATVKKLVEAHGGEVGLKPGLAHGSLFWFVLPAGEPLEAAVQLPH